MASSSISKARGAKPVANDAVRDKLDALIAAIRACRVCRDCPKGEPLPHEPRPVLRISESARLFICSQAPGARVHASGVPFSDPSGVRLRAWLGVSEAEFYDESRIAIAPMGFCFPGNNAKGGDLPPRAECAPLWRERLFASLPRTPELILLVGSYAQRWHLGEAMGATLAETLGNWRAFLDTPSHPRYLPLPHPSWHNTSWLKRNPWFEEEVLPRLRSEVRALL
jgi:uracil-DNA glycosylase